MTIPAKGTGFNVEVNSDDPEVALIGALDQVMKQFAGIDLSLDDGGRARAARWLADRYAEANLFPAISPFGASMSYSAEPRLTA